MVKELKDRQKLRSVLYSWPSLVLMVVITFFFVKGAVGIVMIERENAGRVKDLEIQSTILVEREDNLNKSIARLTTEEGIVEEIKDKFSVTREGEHVAIIVDPRVKATTTEEETGNWFSRLWQNLWGEEK